ncbi:MAG: STAS domain-containing protein [Cyanothece sp. SIO1E1]|nr:STAS domain-containing protein [Cyanothece sp. SIO1E1]
MIIEPEKTNFQVKLLGSSALIHLPSLFTVIEAVSFKETFQQTCQQHTGLEQIVIDFNQTNFIDSSGIGVLVMSRKAAQNCGIELILRNISAEVMLTFALTDLDTLFTIEPKPEPVAPTKAQKPCVTHPSVRSRTKRLIDILGALVGLSITVVLLMPIAIAIKWEDSGPIFFSQTRCSWMGRRFKIWKVRSMVVNAERLKHTINNRMQGPLSKDPDDPRITKVGRFIRRTSLDELPQFWNVLKGDMSLVGTRPPTPDELEKYDVPQWQRLDVKPGMTGEWQVNGRSSVTSFDDVIQLDLKYQRKWSLMYDIKLICKTILVIFNKDAGAV